ncbi:MAG: 30S ribosomal protein S16, partial [Pseudomonadota bacterium]
PYFTLVATDSRSKRDGDFIEKLGRYHPNPTNNEGPLQSIDVEKISAWLKKGAQMSDTVRTLLKNNKIKVVSK